MQLDIKTLCQYRLERAKEDLLTAENNHDFVGTVESYIQKKF